MQTHLSKLLVPSPRLLIAASLKNIVGVNNIRKGIIESGLNGKTRQNFISHRYTNPIPIDRHTFQPRKIVWKVDTKTPHHLIIKFRPIYQRNLHKEICIMCCINLLQSLNQLCCTNIRVIDVQKFVQIRLCVS